MLTDNQIKKLRQAITATVASPIVGSIEDYAWEAIFHYVKDIPLLDPAQGRSKNLYDAVDPQTKTGWSLKSLQLNSLIVGNSFAFVIQRADIIKKSEKLGFPGLTEQSPPEELGAAIIQHWNEKIITSKTEQDVVNSYEGVLLKTINGNDYIYCEYPLELLDATTFSWAWSVNRRVKKEGVGLQGNIAGKTELVWYKNQKQLFKFRIIPAQAVRITIIRTRLTLDKYVTIVQDALQAQLSLSSSEGNPEEYT